MTKEPKTYFRTAEAARYYYKITGDRLPTCQTIRNWMSKGKLGYDGSLIKLNHLSRGKIKVTCADWVETFAEEISSGKAERRIRGNRDKQGRRPPPPPPV